MSSILEALKKLEEEKSASRGTGGNIAGKVVKAGRRSKPRPAWWLPAGMTAAALAAVLCTYMLMSIHSNATKPARSSTPGETQQASVPPQELPVQSQQVMTPSSAAAPVNSLHPRPAAPAPHHSLPSSGGRNGDTTPSVQSPVAQEAQLPSGVPGQQATPRNTEKTIPSPQRAALPGHPALSVTGIGWQKDNADRMAVVNGRMVAEGAVVEGARVEEIFPDRVRFSFADRTFEISLGNSSGENP